MRTVTLLLLAAALALPGAASANAEGYTTRIETRPFYGATVTLEEGVRVFRPLPAERQVIINPNGETPLTLGFNETNVYERRVIKNYNYNESSDPAPRSYGGGSFYGPGFYRYGGHGHGSGHGHGGKPGGWGGR